MLKVTFIFCLLFFSVQSYTNEPNIDPSSDMPYLESLYLTLHQNPELSYKEKQTSQLLSNELSQMGFEVTNNIGGFGVVALLYNGEGPTIMIRTDTDALPIAEQTGKHYASRIKTKDRNNNEVGVMHGCGHDIHMTSFIGTCRQ